MKKLLFTLLLLLFISNTFAQDYQKVDATVKKYPRSFTNANRLAERINNDFTREDEKARAIFTWIALNIRYDLASVGKAQKRVGFSYSSEEERIAKQQKMKDDLANTTLHSKKGVCQGYSTLFMILAEKVGLEAVLISGTAKSHPSHIGRFPDITDHAWNAVKINNEWKLVDVTWGAGAVIGNTQKFEFRFNDKYFLTDPEVFVLNHYPDNDTWLFANTTKKQFAQLPLYYGNYHMGGYELLTPTTGIFTPKQGTLKVKIKNVKPTDEIAYVFVENKQFKLVEPTFNNGIAEFEVPLTATSLGILTIYINEKSVLSYKINKS
ncbi:transglutaminase domain-containing protein [Flavobacterium litorale]|uniref:Transglutaminase-like domain-containing protein n=1 Tax=Flavobacterium litorale TaxID=2856519 RepID=A0ABX8V4C2_9FLAO|nr:transglutaminase domain-containing protein [Flavobacterium litorale]QYJ67681.1 hypothetical protein K1I41_08995 [Flavobacterium litorale]